MPLRHAPPPKRDLEQLMLPEQEKLALCEQLLQEFGLDIKRRTRDELVHGCKLPWSTHGRQDHDPTASLNFETLTYFCLGCGTGGGLLWFIATMRDCDQDEAREWLNAETGMGGQVMELPKLLAYFDALYAQKATRPPPPVYDLRIVQQWQCYHPYFTDPPPNGRGIPDQTVEKLMLGYDPDTDRVVFPHVWRGKCVGWQSRRWWDDGSEKYKSTPEFPKDTTLYNYDPRRKKVVVVESMATAARHLHHCPELTATMGAAVTEAQAMLLAKHEHVVLFMDPDKAGWDATGGIVDDKGRVQRVGLGDLLMPYTRVSVVPNPYDVDGGDMDDGTFDALVDEDGLIPYPVWERPAPDSLQHYERTPR